MAPLDRGTAMLICAWCDQPTPAGAPCVACAGDPEGPFSKPTGLAVVRERRLAARQEMLAARRRSATPPARGPYIDQLATSPPPATDRRAAADRASADERLRAALELAPEIVDPAGPAPAPDVDLGDPRTWPAAPSDQPTGASLAPTVEDERIEDRAAERAARRQAWAAPPRGRPWGLPAEPTDGGADPAVWRLPDASPRKKPRRAAKVVGMVFAVCFLVAALVVLVLSLLGTKKPPAVGAPVSAPAPWVPFHGPGFTVEFPGQPKAAVDTADKVPGVTGQVSEWVATDGGGGYVVIEMPIPPGAGLNRAALAAAFISQSAASGRGTVTSSKTSQIGPYVVEDATIRAPRGYVETERVMIGATTGWALVAGDSGQPAPGWQQFLLSFDPSA